MYCYLWIRSIFLKNVKNVTMIILIITSILDHNDPKKLINKRQLRLQKKIHLKNSEKTRKKNLFIQ